MKKYALFLLTGLVLLAGACTKDALDFQILPDDDLAQAIADDRGKEATNPAEMPADALNFIEEEHFDSYIESCQLAREKDYEVELANGERLYFNLRGRALRFLRGPVNGPCGPLGGQMIPLADLRPAIIEYIEENYPDHTILRAKRRGDKVVVLLSDHLVLVFSQDGVMELDGQHWVDCRPCVPGSQVNIPQEVLDMIQTRMPGAEIVRVCRRGDRIVLGVTYDDGRRILVFDQDWNFLFAHP